MNIEEIKEYLTTVSEESKIYLGCDSERVRKNGIWYADYAIVLVVHKGGNNGCKIFGDIIRERDYDQKKDKPALRLMTEVYKVSAFYLENLEFLESYDTEIHIDINPDEQFGSSCVLSQAIGYIKGVCQIEPKVKPEAFCASYAADRFAYIQSHTSKKEGRKNKRKRMKQKIKLKNKKVS